MIDHNEIMPTLDLKPALELPDYKAVMGEAVEEGVPKAQLNAIISAIQAVQDPELMLNVYELGLIYNIEQQENGDVFILMSLTSPACPVAGDMPVMVATAVSSVVGVGKTTVELTFNPPWTVDRLSDDIKLLMGF